VDLDVLYAEYQRFITEMAAEPAEEEILPPLEAPLAAAVYGVSTLTDFDAFLGLERAPAAERKCSSDRADGKHMHFSLAALKREAKAKRLARPQWLPDRLAEDMERLWAQHAADQAAAKVDEGLFV
jgi:hypothetical protein